MLLSSELGIGEVMDIVAFFTETWASSLILGPRPPSKTILWPADLSLESRYNLTSLKRNHVTPQTANLIIRAVLFNDEVHRTSWSQWRAHRDTVYKQFHKNRACL